MQALLWFFIAVIVRDSLVFFKTWSLCYEKEDYAGIEVDFAQAGAYYDPVIGPNWWTYYFEPICLGDKASAQWHLEVLGNKMPGAYPYRERLTFDRHVFNDLLLRYIKIKPFINDKVDHFANEHLMDAFVIGVHYRGTDKIYEAPRVSYDMIIKNIEAQTQKLELNEFKIFVATDEAAFIHFMESKYPGKVVFWDSNRSLSVTPVHLQGLNNYRNGEDALIDCLLLAKTDLIIRTSSNLSLVATYFNPDVPVILLNLGKYDLPEWLTPQEIIDFR